MIIWVFEMIKQFGFDHNFLFDLLSMKRFSSTLTSSLDFSWWAGLRLPTDFRGGDLLDNDGHDKCVDLYGWMSAREEECSWR